MSSESQGKKLLNWSGNRSFYKLLVYSLIPLLAFLSACACKQMTIKAVAAGESFEFKGSYVKYINIENDDSGANRHLVVYMTREGEENLYRMAERNVGKNLSFYFGGTHIEPDLFIAEPAWSGKVALFVNDELMVEILKAYPSKQ